MKNKYDKNFIHSSLVLEYNKAKRYYQYLEDSLNLYYSFKKAPANKGPEGRIRVINTYIIRRFSEFSEISNQSEAFEILNIIKYKLKNVSVNLRNLKDQIRLSNVRYNQKYSKKSLEEIVNMEMHKYIGTNIMFIPGSDFSHKENKIKEREREAFKKGAEIMKFYITRK